MDRKLHRIQYQKNMQDVETMVQEAYPLIYSYVLRRVYDQALAKDITQDTFYRFFRSLATYEYQGKSLNYLYRIAGNLIMDVYRERKRYVDGACVEAIVDDRPQPATQVRQNSEQEVMQDCVSCLSAKDQEVLILRYYQDLKFKDIAEITGMNVSTVKSRVKSALQRLEHIWKEREEHA